MKLFQINGFALTLALKQRLGTTENGLLTVADPGEGPTLPPLFLDQTEARRAKKIWGAALSPLSQGLDDRPPFSEDLNPPLY